MEVELNQCNGKTMLQKGWQEFKERYSIGFGHFTVFEYNGISQFNVLIFDMTAVEINYPFDADYKGVTKQEPESDDSIVLLEEFSTGNRRKRKAKNLLARQQNSRQSRRCDDTIEISDDYPVRKSHRVKHDESTSEERSDGNQCSDRVEMQKPVAKETCIAYHTAIAFVSSQTPQKPFFICLLQRSYVSGRFLLNVPRSFAKLNLPCKGANSIIMVTDGKKWSVRCLVRNSHASVSVGWKEFVQDNGLKLGDACIFEVANKSNKLVWNVVIFRS